MSFVFIFNLTIVDCFIDHVDNVGSIFNVLKNGTKG